MRIAKSQWTVGNAMFVTVYMVLNYVAIVLAPGYSLDIGTGSLSVANTMFLIVPATRNNVLTWWLGMPFDHVIIYHRFLGRFTLAMATLHFALFLARFNSRCGHCNQPIYPSINSSIYSSSSRMARSRVALVVSLSHFYAYVAVMCT